MDALLQKRTPLRRTFTKTANLLEEELKLPIPDVEKVNPLLRQLEDKGQKLDEMDKCILDLLQSSKCTQEEFDAEFEAIDAYNDRFINLSARAKRLLEKSESQRESRYAQASEPLVSTLKTYRLPELELKKFSGDVKDWLGFWGQFQKIDSDPNVAPEDKFQYLLQATVEKSKAREIVESFPPTGENYAKAVEHLKSRFGREETLVEVYIRDLLKLVLKNAQNRKQRVDLSSLYDKLETQLRALETLGVTSEKYAAMLYPLVESCLPEDVLKAWERNKGFKASVSKKESEEEKGLDRLTLLMSFLRDEVEGEERVKMARSGFGIETESQKRGAKRDCDADIPTAAGLFSSPHSVKEDVNNSCIFCERKHSSSDCLKAKNMPIEKKRQLAFRSGCCYLCVRRGHTAKTCKGKQRCTFCKGRHHAVMCPNVPCNPASTSTASEKDSVVVRDSALSNHTLTSTVQLQTLKVYLRGDHGRHIIRALIDTGSQRSYISTKAAEFMGYEVIGEEKVTHSLFGGMETFPQKHRKFRIYLTSMNEKYKCNFEVLDQDKICANVAGITNGPWIEELSDQGIYLTDTASICTNRGNGTDAKIQLLIGADIAGKLLTGNIRVLSCGLAAVETHLGWTVMGKIPKKDAVPSTYASSVSIVSLLVHDSSMADLWRLESLGIVDPSERQTNQELQKAAHEHFRQTVTFDEHGRYEVSLPWLEKYPLMSNNLQLATRRLKTTVKKLKSENILEPYQEVLYSWLAEEIIEEVPPEEVSDTMHFLPHRAVVKENSSTKVRPVFDASSHEKNFPSLNDCLAKGPNLLELVPSVLTRFRMKRIGVTSDIRQAFLQISVRKEDRNVLCFLWHKDGDSEQTVYFRHCRVVFGVTSSPFLLCATIAYHLDNVPDKWKETAALLQESFYVDNCVTSVDSSCELETFISESKQIMLEAKFDLRGWQYNEPQDQMQKNTYAEISEASTEGENSEEDSKAFPAVVPVLGMCWDLKDDVLFIKLNAAKCVDVEPVTKRKVLSATQQVFDPLGVVCPVTLLPKLLLQETWNLKLSWDEELPEDISRKFLKWVKQLETLERIKVPRWIIGGNCTPDRWTLHTFCDASKYAYAACIFVRVERLDGVYCQLVRAKARVTPLKLITIPRLELLACCIGARLADAVKSDMRCPNVKTFYWTDSANALYWIKNNDQWAIFVANRVKEIRSLSDSESWRHIPGNQNPADIPSRGCTVQQLLHLSWWEGPEWLRMHPENWPKSFVVPDDELINSERKKTVIVATNSAVETRWYEKYSSLRKIIRIIAWMYRFVRNAQSVRAITRANDLAVEEIINAELSLSKLVQKDSFNGVTDATLKSLQPFEDERGIIRVRTRLTERADTENFKYPIVLPSKHHIVTLIVQEMHYELKHAGVQIVIANLREKFWILRCRKTVRQAIRNCGRCRRFKAVNADVIPAPLPQDRVGEAAVFQITGIDLAGPMFLKGGEKAWLVLFTCAVYRAVHIELVTSLSTEVFIQSFRRFISRRGRPTTVYSDNGTNFVGAARALQGIDWNKIREYATNQRIHWKFIPPTAAWWGGWWERLIRMIKEILRSVLGKAVLTYQELLTLLCETEGVVNSRPMTYMSEDVGDLMPLTPAMFMQDISNVEVPDLDSVDKNSIKKRFKYLQRLRENLRKRFRSEYLGQLRSSIKMKRHCGPLKVGQVVLLGSDNMKRLDWPLAKIEELYPGKDGHVRVAKVKTQKGYLLRPIQRLYPLEMDAADEEVLPKTSPNSCRKSSGKSTQRQNDGQKEPETVPAPVVTTRSGRLVKRPERLVMDSF